MLQNLQKDSAFWILVDGKWPGNDEKYPKFTRIYGRIHQASADYRIIDCQQDEQVDYCIDLNVKGSPDQLQDIINEFKPDVILCMETLEPCELPL